MKKIISWIFITIGLILLSVNLVRAIFHPRATLTEMSFKVGDFVAPEKVLLDDKAIYSDQDFILLSWEAVNDFRNKSEPVYYHLAINNKEYRAYSNNFNLDVSVYENNEYPFRVKACDQLDNCSDWSNYQSLIINRRDPCKYLIGNDQSTNYWQDNYLELTIENSSQFRFFTFDYLTYSKENLPGFDQTKLVVTINDQLVFIEDKVVTEWKSIFISLESFSDLELVVKFYSGNSGDSLLSSWAEVKNIGLSFEKENNDPISDINFDELAKEFGIIF
jgi:hypothetical protein